MGLGWVDQYSFDEITLVGRRYFFDFGGYTISMIFTVGFICKILILICIKKVPKVICIFVLYSVNRGY